MFWIQSDFVTCPKPSVEHHDTNLMADKKDKSASKIPEFSQVGTIIEGPTEYFSGRLSNKERKQTFVEEVLAREKSEGRFKAKYNDIQAAKTSGKKAHFKKMKDLRRGGGSKNR
jgi:hypothetical protein